MKISKIIIICGILLTYNTALTASTVMDNYQALVKLQGEWVLAPADQQEGGATKKGPAAKIVGTDKTAMSFKVIGKGSTVQENLLPGTSKEMATMYHCDKFKSCSQIKAKHYCAMQNQPELILEQSPLPNIVSMVCDPDNPLCNSDEGHVHKITHELSDSNNLKTTYTIFKDRKFKKSSIYHFVRK